MPTESGPAGSWNVLLVEDDGNLRRQVKEYLASETFASQSLNISEISDLSNALNLIRERKADLVILDVYRGQAQQGGEQVGVEILSKIKESGFVPVIFYTALPEGLEGYKGKFVRLVGKETGGLEKLREEISGLFDSHVPQMNRAIINHLDQSMRSYMWEFVQDRWAEFEPLSDKPEFVRLVVQRLALTFAREGMDQIASQVYGNPFPGATGGDHTIHPAECYLKPPIGKDPVLGDIRLRETDGKREYLVVLWPTCDMVSTGGRVPKTDFVLCARATLATEEAEVREWRANSSNNKKEKVERLIKNTRDGKSSDRFHFLPGVWDIPHLVVDFQALEHLPLANVRDDHKCLATLASPFAEAMASRFQKYIGRIGTPDLDVGHVIAQLQLPAAPTATGSPGSEGE